MSRQAQPGSGAKEHASAALDPGTVARFVGRAAATLNVSVTMAEPLARHTTFRIGGPADLYAAATTIDQLERLAVLAAEHGIPATILGGGSNVLVSDAGVRGLVIANQTRACELRAAQLVTDSGVALAGLARTAMKSGLAGLEWAISVPGTVGGAVIGNAGAHGGDIAANLAWALISYPGQMRQVWTAAQMEFAYRSSLLKRQLAHSEAAPVVLAAAFNLAPGDIAEMAARADSFLARRRSSQPAEPSAGSIFRNPPGGYAGRLVEAAGLKGQGIGGAQISTRHANFIVNTGGATAADVIALMQLMRRRIYEDTGIELISEILLLGEWPEPEMAGVR